MPRFSVIVPVYNVLPYLSQCVESIVKQSFQDYELILVDDGSTDGSGNLCDELAHKYEKIRVVHKENGGLVSARKAGLLKAVGEYVLCVDSDDYVGINLLQNVEDIIDKHNPDIIAFDFCNVTEEGENLFVYANKEVEGLYTEERLEQVKSRFGYNKTVKRLNNGSIANSLCTKVFRKNYLEESLLAVPDKISQGEDLAAAMPAICACHSLYISHYVGYFYRQRNASIVHSFDNEEPVRREVLISHLLNRETGMDENIYLYAYVAMVEYVSKVAAFAKSFSEFRNIMAEEKNQAFLQRARKVSYKYFDLKENMRLFCIKHRLWVVLWAMKALR